MKSRILVGLIAGTLGGFLGWLFQEHLIDYNAHVVQGLVPGQAIIRQGLSQSESRVLVLCVGGLIGMVLGAIGLAACASLILSFLFGVTPIDPQICLAAGRLHSRRR